MEVDEILLQYYSEIKDESNIFKKALSKSKAENLIKEWGRKMCDEQKQIVIVFYEHSAAGKEVFAMESAPYPKEL